MGKIFMSFTLVFAPRNNVLDFLAFSYSKKAQGNFLITLGVAVTV